MLLRSSSLSPPGPPSFVSRRAGQGGEDRNDATWSQERRSSGVIADGEAEMQVW